VYDETNYKTYKTENIYVQLAALKMLRKMLPDIAWPGGQNFSG